MTRVLRLLPPAWLMIDANIARPGIINQVLGSETQQQSCSVIVSEEAAVCIGNVCHEKQADESTSETCLLEYFHHDALRALNGVYRTMIRFTDEPEVNENTDTVKLETAAGRAPRSVSALSASDCSLTTR